MTTLCAAPLQDLLQTTLEHLRLASTEGVVVAVTSANPGEGVTHSVSALPGSLRKDGSTRILCVQATDLRAATCAPASLFRFYKPVGDSLFDFRNTGTPSSSPNPRHVWADNWNHRRDCIAQLRSSFDYVFVDCPALKSTDDIFLMAPLLDGIILVVEADKTPVDEILQMEDTIQLAGGKLLGHILNKRKRDLPTWLPKALRLY